jgi:hypothetical protein
LASIAFQGIGTAAAIVSICMIVFVGNEVLISSDIIRLKSEASIELGDSHSSFPIRQSTHSWLLEEAMANDLHGGAVHAIPRGVNPQDEPPEGHPWRWDRWRGQGKAHHCEDPGSRQ